jgi:hypothetical protein
VDGVDGVVSHLSVRPSPSCLPAHLPAFSFVHPPAFHFIHLCVSAFSPAWLPAQPLSVCVCLSVRPFPCVLSCVAACQAGELPQPDGQTQRAPAAKLKGEKGVCAREL